MIVEQDETPPMIDTSWSILLRVATTAIVAGILTVLLALLLKQYLLPAIMSDADVARDGWSLATNIALVVTSIGAVVTLVRLSVYRPLLIVLASAVSLWGIGSWLVHMSLIEQLLWAVGLHLIAYLAFSWLARVRHAVVVIILAMIAVLLVKVIPLYIQ